MPPGAGAAREATGPPAVLAGTGPSPQRRPFFLGWLRAFAHFWWDFLVGDTPELFLGAAVALGVIAVLVKAYSLNAVAVGAFPALVTALLASSAYRARRPRQ